MAGTEHMLMWADLSEPLEAHDDQVMTVALTKAGIHARAGDYGGFGTSGLAHERAGSLRVRQAASVAHPLGLPEHRKSKLSQADKDAIKAREDGLLERVGAVFEPDEIKAPRGYLDVIRSACAASDLGQKPDVAQRLWRAASGAAHGKLWPTLELQRIEVGEEYEPSWYKTLQIPDATAITEVLEAAITMSQYGVLRFVSHSGVDLAVAWGEARDWVAERIPLLAGPSREEVTRVRHPTPRPTEAAAGTRTE